ncbi:calcium-binding protein [Streptomyces sp. NPDC090306]|uniref:calcium-binding protein n=1 Tax=unclassified Streptomyces TaxID=2593676 RepID=UPI0036E6D8DF
MRTRAVPALAVLAGAASLAALAVPAASAASGHGSDAARAAVAAATRHAGHQTATPHVTARTVAPADEGVGDTAISSVVINGGKDLAVGTTTTSTVKVTFTVSDPAGVDLENNLAILWHGPDNVFDNSDYGFVPNEDAAVCTSTGATTASCYNTFTITAKPTTDGSEIFSEFAGTWKALVIGAGADGDYVEKDVAKTFRIKRITKATTAVSATSVKKGAALTVTGSLTRADWTNDKYVSYPTMTLQLQYEKTGSTTWTVLKNVKADSAGKLKAGVTASATGSYRYVWAGNSATTAATSAAKKVTVK